MIEFQGASPSEPIENMKLEGITIRNSDYFPTGGPFNQYSMIHVQHAKNITIKDNHIYNVGRAAINLRVASQECTVSGNYLHDIGFLGIQVENSSFNLVTNNYIHNVGTMFGHGVGIRLAVGTDNIISHNRIHDSTRYGISMKHSSARNLVQYNDVSNCNTDSQDTGVIELFIPGGGNVIDHNRVYNSDIHLSYGYGIYLDDLSSGVTVTNNLVHGLQQVGKGELRNVRC